MAAANRNVTEASRPLRFGRVVLRPPDVGDVTAVAAWLEQTWLDVRALPQRSSHTPPSAERWLEAVASAPATSLIEVDGEPLGYISYALSDGDCLIHELGVRSERRNLGYGSEAVFAVELWARGSSAVRGVAPVPLANGLAIYFWLRIGYRPDYPHARPTPGITLMVRGLASPAEDAPGSGSRTGARRSNGRSTRRSPSRR